MHVQTCRKSISRKPQTSEKPSPSKIEVTKEIDFCDKSAHVGNEMMANEVKLLPPASEAKMILQGRNAGILAMLVVIRFLNEPSDPASGNRFPVIENFSCNTSFTPIRK